MMASHALLQTRPGGLACPEDDGLLARLDRLAQGVGGASDLTTACRALLAFAQESVPCNGLFVSLYDPSTGLRRCIFSAGDGEEDDVSALAPLPLNGSPGSRAIVSGETVLIDDFQRAVCGKPVVNLGEARDSRLPQSSLTLPLRVMGRIIGAFEVQSTQPAAYGPRHVSAMQMAGSVAAIAIENARLLELERRNQHLVRMAMRVSRMGAWTVELPGRELVWSEDVRALLGLPEGFRPTLAAAFEMCAPEHAEALHAAFERCARTGEPYELELQIVDGRGERRWIRAIAEAEHDDRGGIRRVQGAFQDISDYRHAAEQARLTGERLAATLESMTDAFVTLDREWRFTYVNQRAARMLERSREDLLGRVAWEEFPEAVRGFRGEYELAMAAQRMVQFEAAYEPLGLWLDVRAYPTEHGIAIYFHDASASRAARQREQELVLLLEQRVRERTAELEAANAELEAFSSSVSHDLRAPLARVSGFAACLQMDFGDDLPEDARGYLGRIIAGAQDMDRLIDDLLRLSHSGRGELLRRVLDTNALVAHVVEEAAAGREADLRIAPLPPCFADSGLLRQVWVNLLSNAYKYSAGRERALIEVGCERAGEDDVFFVRDNGVGFDMAHAHKLFGVFQRLHSGRDFAGNGVGLALVQRIVRRHGGRIWGEASPGRGAVFRFTLPPRMR